MKPILASLALLSLVAGCRFGAEQNPYGLPNGLYTEITTERGVVYLMGKVTSDEAQRAGIVASGVTGVNKVVKLFQVVARESILAEPGKPAPVVTDSSSTGTPAPAPAASGGGVQTMPVH